MTPTFIPKFLPTFLLLNLLIVGTAIAECNGSTTERNVFQNQEVYRDILIIKLVRIEDGKEPQDVKLSVKSYNSQEDVHPVKVTHWVDYFRNYQMFDIPDNLQTLTVQATYSDGCNSNHIVQQFQDEIVSLNFKQIMIKWIGKDFFYLFSGGDLNIDHHLKYS